MTPSGANRRHRTARALADAFRDGLWDPPDMAARGAHDLCIGEQDWMTDLAIAVVQEFPNPPHDAPRTLTALIATWLADQPPLDGDVTAWIRDDPTTSWNGPRVSIPAPINMANRRWPVPEIDNVAALARFFGLDSNELDWYCDVRSLERGATEDLRHYAYHWQPKRSGGARLIEAPKQNLKSFQRKILDKILGPIPPHDAAHGFRKGRSIQSYAAPHTAQRVVIRVDLLSFFTTVGAGRIFRIFRSAGYAEDVAHLLTGLVTNSTPPDVLTSERSQKAHGSPTTSLGLLRSPHLPQGAPTSPALANLAAFRLDRRLSALATSWDAKYTRYADDIAVSGGEGLARNSTGFLEGVTEIVRSEGFIVNKKKTRIRTQTQRQVLTGMVVNRHLNIHRRDYDQLKAVLHDAVVRGPVLANRQHHPAFRAHLEGRISFVQATNPARARKLWRSFSQIDWTNAA